MKEVPTMFQVAAFGDFSTLETNSESVRYFMDSFTQLGLDLIPSLPDTPPPGAQLLFAIGPVPIPKISFLSNDGPWSVNFSNQRVDIYCRKGGTEGPELDSIDEFGKRSLGILTTLVERFPMKFGRMSYVTRHSWVDWPGNSLDDYYRSRVEAGKYFKDNVPHEWSLRLISRHDLASLKGERMNVIGNLLRAPLITVTSPQETDEGIECTLDLNTLPDNQEARFSVVEFQEFLSETVELERSVRTDLSK